MPLPSDPTHAPRIRPTLSAEPVEGGVVLFDPHRVGRAVPLTMLGLEIARRLDGTRTPRDLQAEVTALAGGRPIPLDTIVELVAGLDDALLLDSPRFAAAIGGPVREPSCIGCYDADPIELRKQLGELFTATGGPGMPGAFAPSPQGRLRAALLPHMDYGRGNITYGYGFKELVERTDATVFVIVATSHYSMHRLTLTRQHFATPLGIVPTDETYINRIVDEYGDGLFDDQLAHFPEHSIELEVVLLQYLLDGRRPFRIVPLLVGSFGDCVEDASSPAERTDIARMVTALRTAEAECPDPVCYLISGDLAHIGPKFGDPAPVADPWLNDSRKQDAAILSQLERADAGGYFDVIAREADRRRICGLPPTYLTLAAARPRTGRVLHYQQYVHPEGHESVSFAAAAFYE